MDQLAAELTLDQVDDWFKIGKKIHVDTVPKSKLGGRYLDPATGKAAIPNNKSFVPPYKRHTRLNNPNQTAYATHYQQVENEQCSLGLNMGGGASTYEDDSESVTTGGFERLEADSIATGIGHHHMLPDGVTEEDAVQVYDSYKLHRKHKYNPSLSITAHRDEIVDTIESNQVTVIQGETGSGKTTQVPQYILDHYANINRYCNIVVTQPRRIAAMSICRRVCEEREWTYPGICGYQVGLDNVTNPDTRLTYCTTGVLLQHLITSRNMHRYTHIILDEVHERDQDSDFCLLVVRKLLRTNSRDTKVILMSATIDADLFASYFALPVRGLLEPAPVYQVEGRCFTVSEYFIEDLKKLGPIPLLEPDNPGIPAETVNLACKLIQQFDELEIQQFGGMENGVLSKNRGSVLCFLPGMAEITEIDEALKDQGIEEKYKLWIRPLHSSIASDGQVKVFHKPQVGYRKVILSTNIAESSITVPDIKYVIDFCLTKQSVCDPETNYTSLQVQWASRANCTQRKGRAGRVSNGRVYRMVSREFWKDYIPDYGIPEMQRCSLEQLVLKVKVLNLGEPKAILGLALAPPNLDDIERTVLALKEAGALATNSSGSTNPHDGRLTFVGQVLAKLPVDTKLGKLMMLGHVFGLLEETIIISACLSLRSFFRTPYKGLLEAYKAKLGWSMETYSDCIACLFAYRSWTSKRELGLFPSIRQETDWGKKCFLEIRRIKEVSQLVEDLKKRLFNCNIMTPRGPALQHNPDLSSVDQLLLKVVLCGAFYPNYFVQGCQDEEMAIKSIAGRNPLTTIVVRGLPANQGSLYTKQIEAIFQRCEQDCKPRVHSEETRAYIEFQGHQTGVHPAVYIAIKMRLLRIPLVLQLLDPKDAHERMEKLTTDWSDHAKAVQRLRTNRVKAVSDAGQSHQRVDQGRSELKTVALPPPQQTIIQLTITEIKSCGHFWAHYGDSDTWKKITEQHKNINMFKGKNLIPLPPTLVKPGIVCLAPYSESGSEKSYYRARVESCTGNIAKVFFVDYGNSGDTSLTELKELESHFRGLPLQALECDLCSIKPSAIKCPNGKWTAEAKQAFEIIITKGQSFYAKLYSVVYGVMRVTLFVTMETGEININEKLIDLGYADHADESLTSKQSNSKREADAINERPEALDNWLEDLQLNETTTAIAKSHTSRRGGTTNLSGPWSPYEMNFYNLTNIGRLKTAKIDRESINCVAIDDEPHDKHARMMVAAHVGLNPTGTTMMARDTTLLPNVHGFPALMAILFAPAIELRMDRYRSRYVGVLCGLGWDTRTGGPALPDHDMEITFDTKIDVADIMDINKVRIAINLSIGSGHERAEWGPDATLRIQKGAREKLLSLIRKRRESIEPEPFCNPYLWNQAGELFDSYADEELDESVMLLSLHKFPLPYQASVDDDDTESTVSSLSSAQDEKRSHNKWLHEKASRNPKPEDIHCLLCDVMLQSPRDLLLHLATKRHRQQEQVLV